ncbi:MAG: exodeoxyribonuclease III [Candidatus Dormibacteria bacterium]
MATWNVNSLTARLPRVLGWLEQEHPEVLLIQETKCADSSFPRDALAAMGYESAHHGDGRWNGVAIISRVGIEGVVRGLSTPAPTGLPEPRFISADCGGVRLASVYIPNGREIGHPFFTYKLAWLQELSQVVANDLAHGDLLVGGDFNVAPTDRDVFDPEAFVGATHVTAEERAALQAVIAEGLVDLAITRDDPGFTFWDYRQGFFRRGLGMRIDLLLASAPIAARLTRIWVDRQERAGARPSDHAPLVAELG